MAPPQRGADHAAARAAADHGHPHEVGEVARVGGAGLGHVDAALLGEARGVHVVHVLLDVPRQHPLEDLDGEDAGVALGDTAEVLDLERVDRAALGQRHGHAAEVAGERQERAEHLHVLGGDGGHVHRARDHAPGERRHHLLGGLVAGAVGGLGRGGAEVRGDHHVGIAEQRVVGHRLLAEHVERRARHLAGVERRPQRVLDHQQAARDVDHAHAVLHLREGLGVEPVLGLRRHRAGGW